MPLASILALPGAIAEYDSLPSRFRLQDLTDTITRQSGSAGIHQFTFMSRCITTTG